MNVQRGKQDKGGVGVSPSGMVGGWVGILPTGINGSRIFYFWTYPVHIILHSFRMWDLRGDGA